MLTRDFVFERATKNTYRFTEVSADADALGRDEVVGYLYVQKTAFAKQPRRLKVTIQEME